MLSELPTRARPEHSGATRMLLRKRFFACRTFAWLSCLLFASVSQAQERPGAPRPAVECSKQPRCVAALTGAQTTAKTNKHKALDQMWIIYAAFPDPRLSCELGRLYQQTGQLNEAATQSRLCLESGVTLDPGRLDQARAIVAQAAKEVGASPLPVPSSQEPAPLPPAPDSAQGVEVQSTAITDRFAPRPARPLWRVVLGSVFMVGALLPLGFGAAALGQNGQCSQVSSAMVSRPPCLQTLDTGALGGGLLAGGLLVAAGGVFTLAIPARRSEPLAWSLPTSTADIAAY